MKLVDKLLAELTELIIVCHKNLYHAQELSKQANNKGVKSWSYVPGNKIWLNTKYIKTKRNQKLEAKFFKPFWMLYPIGKQVYKLKLLRKWKIHDVFYILLLEQDITRKWQVDKNATKLNASNEGEKYKIDAIQNNIVYARDSKSGHLLGLYFLVS